MAQLKRAEANAKTKETLPKKKQTNRGKPIMEVATDFEGAQREGVPVADDRSGKKNSRAGRRKKDANRVSGRKRDGEVSMSPPTPAEIVVADNFLCHLKLN
jgi:hypothetical protein